MLDIIYINNKEERYSRVPRLSDTRYSAKGTKCNGGMQATKRDIDHLFWHLFFLQKLTRAKMHFLPKTIP